MLVTLYKIPSFESVDDFLYEVATVRCKLKKGGHVYTEAAATIVLHDWSEGKIPLYTMPPKRDKGEDAESRTVTELAREFNISGFCSLNTVNDFNPVEIPSNGSLSFDETMNKDVSKNQTEEEEAGLDSHDEFMGVEGGEETGKSKSETSSQNRKLHAALRFVLACLLMCVLGLPSSLAQPVPHSFRISCGSQRDVRSPPSYTVWHKDSAYTGGVSASATLPSEITPSLKTLRYFPISEGPRSCYNILRVSKGQYTVRIFFGLLKSEAIFDVSIEGTQVSSLMTGWSTGEDDQVFAEGILFLLNGTATICFHNTGHGDPAIISLELLQIQDRAYEDGESWDKGVVLRTVKRLNCGSRKPKYDEDYNGNIWGGNRFWSPASLAKNAGSRIATEHAIRNSYSTPNMYPERLYQSALVSNTDEELAYKFDVMSGNSYSVWLHFAEIDDSVTAERKRVFDILLNGAVVFEGVDIIKMAGESYAALVLNRTVTSTGSTLTVILNPKEGSALICAIEVFEVLESERKTSRDEADALLALKKDLGVPSQVAWNGDPCAPPQHPWIGVHCQLSKKSSCWFIDGLDLHNQSLGGSLTSNIATLKNLKRMNLSQNNIHGGLPASLGNMKSLEILDLSYNSFNGSIPESLRVLPSLRILKLEGNLLLEEGSAPVPESKRHPSHRTLVIALSATLTFIVIVVLVCATMWWRKQQDITRAQHPAAIEVPYFPRS